MTFNFLSVAISSVERLKASIKRDLILENATSDIPIYEISRFLEDAINTKYAARVEAHDVNFAVEKTKKIEEFCLTNQVSTISIGSALYPVALLDLSDKPSIIYFSGDASFLSEFEKNIAVIGTRKPLPFYVNCAERIADTLSNEGFNVISGLALGCDAAAHRACLISEKPGKTGAILASGLDNITPRENMRLAKDIVSAGGCLLSEKAPFEKVQRYDFVKRNRIQAAISQKIIIVEAAENSGTMTTAAKGLELKRSIGVISASPKLDGFSLPKGNKALISRGAKKSILLGRCILFWTQK